MLYICALTAIILGSIHWAYWLGRLRGVDIRKHGSGNVGATNLGRILGVRWGVLAYFLDAAKGFGPTLWSVMMVSASSTPESTSAPDFFVPLPWAPILVSALSVMGHCFSPFMKLKGGKGVATATGVLLALHPLVTLILLLSWAVFLKLFSKVGIASVLAAAIGAAMGIYFLVESNGKQSNSLALGCFLCFLSFIVIIRHKQNIQELMSRRAEGKE